MLQKKSFFCVWKENALLVPGEKTFSFVGKDKALLDPGEENLVWTKETRGVSTTHSGSRPSSGGSRSIIVGSVGVGSRAGLAAGLTGRRGRNTTRASSSRRRSSGTTRGRRPRASWGPWAAARSQAGRQAGRQPASQPGRLTPGSLCSPRFVRVPCTKGGWAGGEGASPRRLGQRALSCRLWQHPATVAPTRMAYLASTEDGFVNDSTRFATDASFFPQCI